MCSFPSQTPVDDYKPDEATMLRNFFDQVQLADELGYGIAWIAQAHLSTEIKTQQTTRGAHFEGDRTVYRLLSVGTQGLCLYEEEHRSWFCGDEFDVQWWTHWHG